MSKLEDKDRSQAKRKQTKRARGRKEHLSRREIEIDRSRSTYTHRRGARRTVAARCGLTSPFARVPRGPRKRARAIAPATRALFLNTKPLSFDFLDLSCDHTCDRTCSRPTRPLARVLSELSPSLSLSLPCASCMKYGNFPGTKNKTVHFLVRSQENFHNFGHNENSFFRHIINAHYFL